MAPEAVPPVPPSPRSARRLCFAQKVPAFFSLGHLSQMTSRLFFPGSFFDFVSIFSANTQSTVRCGFSNFFTWADQQGLHSALESLHFFIFPPRMVPLAAYEPKAYWQRVRPSFFRGTRKMVCPRAHRKIPRKHRHV